MVGQTLPGGAQLPSQHEVLGGWQVGAPPPSQLQAQFG
jgi:hypothetical protein